MFALADASRRLCLAVALLLVIPPAFAQSIPQDTANSAEARNAEVVAAAQAAEAGARVGPADIPLLDQARLHLPQGMIFVPPAQATRLLRAMGNPVHTDPIGLVVGKTSRDPWIVVIRFVAEGFVKDDDAKDWDADKMLQSIQASTVEANKERVSRGFPEIEVVGWIARPHYDAATHRLVSSLAQRRKDAPANAVHGANYVTYALGRSGYLSFDMLTNESRVAADQVAAATLLAGLEFNPGHRYSDFDASTDHVAEYGLAALVGVVAAKKLGLLALSGVFLAKFAKLGVVAGIAVLAFLRRLFRGKPKSSDAA